MDLETIKTGIRNWNELRDNRDELIILFNQGNCFHMTLKAPPLPVDSTSNTRENHFICAYPAVFDGQFHFVLLPFEQDKIEELNEHKNNLDFVEVSNVFLHLPQSTVISNEEALKRMQDWERKRIEWVDEQITGENEMFQVFRIPMDGLRFNFEYKVFLGLKSPDTNQESTGLIGDLIVWDGQLKKIVYPRFDSRIEFRDTARLAPPFAPNKINHFHLLCLTLNLTPEEIDR